MRALPILAPLFLAAALPAVAQDWGGVARAVESGIRGRVFPGAVVVVGRQDTILYARGFGRLSFARGAPRPSPDSTLWDLASLTKIVATTSTVMRLVDRGLLDLDAPVSRYLPAFRGDQRDEITVRMLLDHTSGLRPWSPLHRAPTRAAALDALFAEPVDRPPGSATRYSDLNAILLGLVIEAVTGQSLAEAATREVFGPLGLATFRFGVTGPDRARAAPSLALRSGPAPGLVNDANARRLGGVAGHAGLFGSAMDLARFAQVWLRGGRSAPEAREAGWVTASTVRLFLAPTSSEPGRRALGWDRADTTRSIQYGARAHDDMRGHTGWTGTSLWIDPVHDLFVVLLTNRSLQERRGSLDAMRTVRAAVSDAAVAAGGR